MLETEVLMADWILLACAYMLINKPLIGVSTIRWL